MTSTPLAEEQQQSIPVTTGIDVSKIDEVTTLEYTSLKIPYELFNKRFRTAQKSIEKHNFRVREAGSAISKAIKNKETGELAKVGDLKPNIKFYLDRLNGLTEAYKQVVSDELTMGYLLKARVDYLKEATTSDEIKREAWRNQRVNRLIIDFLLRSGYFESAQKLAEQCNVEDMCNKSVFLVAKQVEDSLSRHETDRCLEWIADNKSKLRRLKSSLETNVRLQNCIEMVRNGERLRAILYARRFLMNIAKDMWTDQVVKVMGLIGFGVPLKSRAYNEFFSQERWDNLVEQFRSENARVYKLMEHSSFNACLCMGLSALKTPQCHPDPDSRCPACRPEMFELAEDLPFSHISNSRLVCSYSGIPLNEQNEPYMLPNGNVYGAMSVEKLRNASGEVVCPRTGDIFPYDQLVRVYIL